MRTEDPSDNADRARALALVPVSRETADLFAALVALLRRWQVAKNLVGPATLAQVWTRHVADSAQLPALLPDAVRWVDMGSGAGFPGLVIAILVRDRPGARVDLIESNGRKAAFLREATRSLRLPAHVHAGRIEDVLDGWTDPVDVLTARALAPLADLLRLGNKLLTTGTPGLFPKGQDVERELTEASRYWRFRASLADSKTDPKARIVRIDELRPLS